MKKTITILFLLAFATMNAQEYSYTVTSEAGDSTFTLDVITEINTLKFSIDRTVGLDSTALQRLQYSRIQREYNELGRLYREIDNASRRINVLRQSLQQVGMDDYFNNTLSELDSLFVADNAVIRFGANPVVNAYVQYRGDIGGTQLIRNTSDNSAIAAIVPRSPRYIQLSILAAYQVGGVASVDLKSSDGRFWTGTDNNNIRYVLILR